MLQFNWLKIFDLDCQLNFLDCANNNICTSGVHDCYCRCFVEPSRFTFGLQTAPQVNNAREAVRLYSEQFPQRQSHPDHKIILKLIARGRETGQMQPVRRRSWECFKKCKDCRTRGSRIECL
jgi:hypothetical protein